MSENNLSTSNSHLIYDVIIIGSGIGGLITANLLQKKGYSVVLFEKNNFPGGYFTNFKRKGFNFDVNLHWTGGCEKGGIVYNILKRFNGENCVEFIKIKNLHHWIDQQKNIDFYASTSLSEYIKTLKEIFPEEESEIDRFFNLYSNIFDPNTIRRLADKKICDIINPHFSNPSLKNAILAPLGFFGWPPNELSAVFAVGFSMSHFYQGAYYIKGGAGQLSKSLANIFIRNGGTLFYETEIIKLKVLRNMISGVIAEDKNKNTINYRSKVTIANFNPILLFNYLPADEVFPKTYVENIKKRKPSLSAVNLYLGLNIDLKDYNISDYMIWTSLNRDENIYDLEKNLEKLNYSSLPIGSITIYSNIDPTCCPRGKSVLSVLCYGEYKPFEKISNPNDNKNYKYNSIKNEIAEQIIKSISNILKIPELKSYIEVSELATPITFERYTSNPQGSIMGWKMTPEQFVKDVLPLKTPIENLFLCGHWVSRTGGLPNVARTAEKVGKLTIKYLRQK